MKLYYDPISTTSRPLMIFAAEQKLDLDWELVSLFQGENRAPEFLSINPNGCVPVLVDGSFILTESAAILRYLAEVTNSHAYPKRLQERARVNAALDWFMTNCHAAIGPQLVYPTLYPTMFPFAPVALAEITAAGRAGTARWLQVLDQHMIGPDRSYVAAEELTIADYLGGSVIALLETVDFDFAPYPNVIRWLRGLRALRSWEPTFAAFEGLRTALRPAA